MKVIAAAPAAAAAFAAALGWWVVCEQSLLGVPYVCRAKGGEVVHYRKYVALQFDSAPGGGGIRHVENKYLRPLLLLAKLTGRMPVFPPPALCLEGMHNNGTPVAESDEWIDYYGSYLLQTGLPEGMKWGNDGRLDVGARSAVHYNAKVPYHRGVFEKINTGTDGEYDVVVFDSFEPRRYKGLDGAVRHLELRGDLATIEKPLASALWYAEWAATATKSLEGGEKFGFVHVRRGDYFKYFDVGRCTSPERVAKCIGMMTGVDSVVIATNEGRAEEYVREVRRRVDNLHVWGEADIGFMGWMDNNYKRFLALDALARRAEWNVVTRELRLGGRVSGRLC